MPKCPYCHKEVNFKNVKREKEGVGLLKEEILYYCPHCGAILGFSRGKYI
ncbi:MAG: hypothetical protein V1668_02310 [Patescibacteria group bacterium]